MYNIWIGSGYTPSGRLLIPHVKIPTYRDIFIDLTKKKKKKKLYYDEYGQAYTSREARHLLYEEDIYDDTSLLELIDLMEEQEKKKKEYIFQTNFDLFDEEDWNLIDEIENRM